MKKVLKGLFIAVMILGVMGVQAQEKVDVKGDHPEIQKYADEYDLSPGQVKEISAIYDQFSKRSQALEKKMKEVRLEQRERMKEATPDERAQMKAKMDVLSKDYHQLRMEREEQVISVFNDEQKKEYNAAMEERNKMREKAKARKAEEAEKAPAIKDSSSK